MKNKLQYSFTPELTIEDDVDFAHEWKVAALGDNDKVKLQEVIAWCHENWNSDPNYGHEWHYRLTGETHYLYGLKRASFLPFSDNLRFYLGTDDDQWAVMFKLMWSNLIE